MEPIPQPHLLDPDRILDPQRDNFSADHESRAQMYEDGLRETCGYAQQLWRTLDGVRAYLMGSLPPDPRAPDTQVTCASPTGPDDEDGWVRWIDMFSSVTSVMCGPHGDSGFGYGQARAAAQLRRETPVTPSPPDMSEAPEQRESVEDQGDGAGPSTFQPSPSPSPSPMSTRIRILAGTVIGVLAVRGLLPRRRG